MNMNFSSGMLKETFILNKIKIDAADTSRPKLNVTVTKNIFLSTARLEIFPEKWHAFLLPVVPMCKSYKLVNSNILQC